MVTFARFIGTSIGRKPVLLVDDLAAELDDELRSSLVDIICGYGGQTYFTAIREKDLPELSSLEKTFLRMDN
jgi:recombinational DNA repair ATPase RecF